MKRQKRKSAKSKSKPAPVAKKTTKPAQKASKKQSGNAVPSNLEPEDTVIEECISLFGDPEHPEKDGIITIYRRLQADIKSLCIKAVSNDEHAFSYLVSLGNMAAAVVSNIANARPAFAKSVAIGVTLWPVSISAVKNHPQNLEELRKQLELGTASEEPYDGSKRHREETSCRRILDHCLHIIRQFREIHEWKELLAHNTPTLEILDELLQETSAPGEKRDINKLKHWCVKGEPFMQLAIATHTSDLHAHTEALWRMLGLVSKPTLDGDIINGVLTKSLQLPAQSLGTLNDWFIVIANILLACCNGDPTNSSTLMQIGKSAENKYYQQLCRQQGLPVTEIPRLKRERKADGSEKTNAWTSAKAQLKKAFKSIAWTTSNPKKEVDICVRTKQGNA